VAFGGGIDVQRVLGSRSTYLAGRFGGLSGRALRDGDRLTLGSAPAQRTSALGAAVVPSYGHTLRVVPGRHFGALVGNGQQALLEMPFTVSSRSDRMGYRLDGPSLAIAGATDHLSAAVSMGTVQLPAGGAPILLMADRQTTGGYPVIAHVASVDLGSAAQLRPGDDLRFERISLDEAERLYLERERAVGALRHALAHSP
jgi:antagonist of KipI